MYFYFSFLQHMSERSFSAAKLSFCYRRSWCFYHRFDRTSYHFFERLFPQFFIDLWPFRKIVFQIPKLSYLVYFFPQNTVSTSLFALPFASQSDSRPPAKKIFLYWLQIEKQVSSLHRSVHVKKNQITPSVVFTHHHNSLFLLSISSEWWARQFSA